MSLWVRQNFKSNRQQSVARQYRCCLIVSDMHGGSSAPHIVVVHTREIIMDQRIGVNALKCSTNAQQTTLIYTKYPACF
jgi:hypothetical protein